MKDETHLKHKKRLKTKGKTLKLKSQEYHAPQRSIMSTEWSTTILNHYPTKGVTPWLIFERSLNWPIHNIVNDKLSFEVSVLDCYKQFFIEKIYHGLLCFRLITLSGLAYTIYFLKCKLISLLSRILSS